MILANFASLLPTDTSALEISISALESSISALESSIAPLVGELPLWEYFGFTSAALVVIGVLLELHDIWHRHGEDKTAWALSFFGVSSSLKKPRFFKKYGVELASIILVAGGVAGEVGAGLMIESKNAALRAIDIKLRSANSELRNKSNQLTALLEGDTAQLKAENLKLEAVVQPRTISESDRQKIANKLRQFATSLGGRKVKISSQIGDGETMLVALEIADILRRADIPFDPSGMGRTSWVGTVFMGVRITGQPSDRAFASEFIGQLFGPLKKGVMGGVGPEYKEFSIEVGVKPIEGMPKGWLRQTPP